MLQMLQYNISFVTCETREIRCFQSKISVFHCSFCFAHSTRPSSSSRDKKKLACIVWYVDIFFLLLCSGGDCGTEDCGGCGPGDCGPGNCGDCGAGGDLVAGQTMRVEELAGDLSWGPSPAGIWAWSRGPSGGWPDERLGASDGLADGQTMWKLEPATVWRAARQPVMWELESIWRMVRLPATRGQAPLDPLWSRDWRGWRHEWRDRERERASAEPWNLRYRTYRSFSSLIHTRSEKWKCQEGIQTKSVEGKSRDTLLW